MLKHIFESTNKHYYYYYYCVIDGSLRVLKSTQFMENNNSLDVFDKKSHLMI
jgi:hypothetical protein